jgi:hypothetical protein
MDNALELLITGTRALLNDYAARNKLLGQVEEYSNEDICNAVDLTLQEINYADVYHTSYTVDSIMRSNPYLMRLGVAKNAMFSRMTEKTRNSMPYSDGAGYVDKEGNLAAYQSMYSQIAQKFEDTRVKYKAYLNVHNAMR